MFDSQFESRVRRWHSTCDSRLPSSTSLTTPPVTSLTATYDFGACNRLYQSCASADYETNKCSQTWIPTSSLSYVSCACQPPVYSLFSECQYNGNISCKRTTAAESNIMGYSICSYFWSGSVGWLLYCADWRVLLSRGKGNAFFRRSNFYAERGAACGCDGERADGVYSGNACRVGRGDYSQHGTLDLRAAEPDSIWGTRSI